jgi:hypothetical protein
MSSLKANPQSCAKRLGVRQPSGAFRMAVVDSKAAEGRRTPKPCGHFLRFTECFTTGAFASARVNSKFLK